MTTYATLADTLLGHGVRPFYKFQPPPDMRPRHWYKHSGLTRGLALHLAVHVEHGGYILELGSFIGNSATTWAYAVRYLRKVNVSIVCMDTWLGDVNMCATANLQP